jgi:hypothetical protein
MRLFVLSSVAAFALAAVACGGSQAPDTGNANSDISSKGTAFSCTAYRSDEDSIAVSLRFQDKSDATKLSSVAISLGTEADGIVADYSLKSVDTSNEESVLNLLESTDKGQKLVWDDKPLDLTKYNCFDVTQQTKTAVANIFLCLNKDAGTKSPGAFVVTNYWADASKPGEYDEFACTK